MIELKIGDFKPEYLGKMEFYLTLADEQLKDASDEKSIGLILCKTKDGLVAEYALRDSQKPIGIAEYKINEKLPADIKGELPSIEEIEIRITVTMDLYWYGFKQINFQNQQFFLKKQYAHHLTEENIERICDTAFEQVMDEISRRTESL